jgi:hypothetical protein
MDESEQSPSEAVVAAVAANEGVSETELERPLFEVVDPDALDSLFRWGTGRVTFEYLGYEVTVESGGAVTCRPLASTSV